MKNNYSFIQLTPTMKIPDSLYNGRYNKEPALITIKNGIPYWVQFTNRSAIYDPKGILLSSVEILLPGKEDARLIAPAPTMYAELLSLRQERNRLLRDYERMQKDFNTMYELILSKYTKEEIQKAIDDVNKALNQ